MSYAELRWPVKCEAIPRIEPDQNALTSRRLENCARSRSQVGSSTAGHCGTNAVRISKKKPASRKLGFHCVGSSGAFQCCIHAEQSNPATLVIGGNVRSGTDSEVRGWRSLYYGQKEPALSLNVETVGGLPVRFITVLAPSTVRLSKLNNTNLELTLDGETYLMSLRLTGSEQIFSDMRRFVPPALVTS